MSHAEQLAGLLRDIGAARALHQPRVQLQPTSSDGANYTSHLFLATVSDEHTQLQLFAKVAAVGQKFREQVPMRMFDIENAFYTRLAKIYKQLEDKHNVPDEDKFVPPECYGYSDKEDEEIMVLENLSAQGYVVHDRLKSVDWQYAAKAVVELAKFHALSFAFQREQPEEFDKFVREFSFKWNSSCEQYWARALDTACGAVRAQYSARLRGLLARVDAAGYTTMYEPQRAVVLGHCDYRVSNQMYRIDADGRIHMRVMDYQTLRAAPPVLDLLYFIFTSTDQQFRAQHYDRLLGHYYCELRRALQRFGVHADDVYTREDFDLEYKAKLPFGLCVAVYALPVITVDVANAPKVDRDMEMSTFAVNELSPLFLERLDGIIEDFIRWGVL